MGAAIALALANEGWRVALDRAPRRTTEAVAAQARGALVLALAISATQRRSTAMGEQCWRISERGGAGECGGDQCAQRAIEVLTHADYHEMMSTNLNGAYYCVQAVLPQMRASRLGDDREHRFRCGPHREPEGGPRLFDVEIRHGGPHTIDQCRGASARHPRDVDSSPATSTRRFSTSARLLPMPRRARK